MGGQEQKKKVLIIQGNPDKESFCHALAESYKKGALSSKDTPPWYFRLIYGQPGHKAMKKSTLGFCGIKPVRISSIGPVKSSKKGKRTNWLNKVQKLGENLA